VVPLDLVVRRKLDEPDRWPQSTAGEEEFSIHARMMPCKGTSMPPILCSKLVAELGPITRSGRTAISSWNCLGIYPTNQLLDGPDGVTQKVTGDPNPKPR
jgi:hypothetical protein